MRLEQLGATRVLQGWTATSTTRTMPRRGFSMRDRVGADLGCDGDAEHARRRVLSPGRGGRARTRSPPTSRPNGLLWGRVRTRRSGTSNCVGGQRNRVLTAMRWPSFRRTTRSWWTRSSNTSGCRSARWSTGSRSGKLLGRSTKSVRPSKDLLGEVENRADNEELSHVLRGA